MFTDFRLKVLRFFRRNSKIIFIVICVWVTIFIVNMMLRNYNPKPELQTTYTPHTSVIDPRDSVPKSISNPVEEMIEKYVGYCNEADWPAAYNMLSAECKQYGFNNDIKEFKEYVYTKMPTEKKYAIQNYSNDGNTYIYQIKYTDDILATGLTNSEYQYTEEKMIFKKQKDGSIDMTVGNFVEYAEIKNISENDYLKVDVKSVVKYYSMEQYEVKITNRTDYTIVISDGQYDSEAVLVLNSNDVRQRLDKAENEIVLRPKESSSLTLKFQKFYDNKDEAKSLNFGAIRVMEKYSGTNGIAEEIKQSEIQNAITKFSVSIPVNYED